MISSSLEDLRSPRAPNDLDPRASPRPARPPDGVDLGGIDPAAYARRWTTLGVLCLSLTVVMVANVSLNLALPALARDLGASTSALQWMVDSYALVFAGLLFTAGTLGDRFGRKGTLQAGLGLFLVGAAVAATASTSAMVIAGRGVMGVAAAFVMPSTLSILTSVFPPEERGRAISTWAGVAAGAAALGPTGSGLLLEHFWWGSVFLVNVPLVVAALVAGIWLVPTSRDPDRHPLDVPGAVLSIAGIGSLVYAIIEAPAHGWGDPRTLAAFGGRRVRPRAVRRGARRPPAIRCSTCTCSRTGGSASPPAASPSPTSPCSARSSSWRSSSSSCWGSRP